MAWRTRWKKHSALKHPSIWRFVLTLHVCSSDPSAPKKRETSGRLACQSTSRNGTIGRSFLAERKGIRLLSSRFTGEARMHFVGVWPDLRPKMQPVARRAAAGENICQNLCLNVCHFHRPHSCSSPPPPCLTLSIRKAALGAAAVF